MEIEEDPIVSVCYFIVFFNVLGQSNRSTRGRNN